MKEKLWMFFTAICISAALSEEISFWVKYENGVLQPTQVNNCKSVSIKLELVRIIKDNCLRKLNDNKNEKNLLNDLNSRCNGKAQCEMSNFTFPIMNIECQNRSQQSSGFNMTFYCQRKSDTETSTSASTLETSRNTTTLQTYTETYTSTPTLITSTYAQSLEPGITNESKSIKIRTSTILNTTSSILTKTSTILTTTSTILTTPSTILNTTSSSPDENYLVHFAISVAVLALFLLIAIVILCKMYVRRRKQSRKSFDENIRNNQDILVSTTEVSIVNEQGDTTEKTNGRTMSNNTENISEEVQLEVIPTPNNVHESKSTDKYSKVFESPLPISTKNDFGVSDCNNVETSNHDTSQAEYSHLSHFSSKKVKETENIYNG